MADAIIAAVLPWIGYVVAGLVAFSPILAMQIPVVGPLVAKLLRWRLPLPIHLLAAVAVVIWAAWNSSIIRAVKSSAKDIVAGEELAAAKARENRLQLIIDVQSQNLRDERKALAVLQGKLIDAKAVDDKGLKDDLESNAKERAASSVVGCGINDGLWGRLRNR